MPSCNTYHLSWVSLTVGVGYLFRAAPAKHSHCFLPWKRGISLPLPFLTLAQAAARAGAVSAAERSYPRSEIRGSGLERQAMMAQEQPRGATPRPRSGAAAYRSYSTFKVRRGGGEEIPLVQGKEQRLCFAGAALKRYPMPKVRETQVRW